MSRRRQNRTPFWQDNVLHVPTSPFMSPVQSPAASPIHSPLVSPRNRASQSPDVDIASAILTSISGSSPVLSIDDLLARLASSRGVLVSESDAEADAEADAESGEREESGSSNNPIDVDAEEGEQYHLDRSVQRAYENFLSQVQRQNLMSPVRSASPLQTPPPPTMPLRAPPPPPLFERRPTNLRVITNRRPRVVIRLPNGGYTFAGTNLSPRRSRRRSTRTLSEANRPLIRQVVTLSDTDMRRRIARNRVQRYTRQLEQTAQSAAQTADAVLGFKLTESFGLPEDKCAICLEPYKFGDTVSYVACQPHNGGKDHLFHAHCINQWVDSLFRSGNYTRSCPVCRGEF